MPQEIDYALPLVNYVLEMCSDGEGSFSETPVFRAGYCLLPKQEGSPDDLPKYHSLPSWLHEVWIKLVLAYCPE